MSNRMALLLGFDTAALISERCGHEPSKKRSDVERFFDGEVFPSLSPPRVAVLKSHYIERTIHGVLTDSLKKR